MRQLHARPLQALILGVGLFLLTVYLSAIAAPPPSGTSAPESQTSSGRWPAWCDNERLGGRWLYLECVVELVDERTGEQYLCVGVESPPYRFWPTDMPAGYLPICAQRGADIAYAKPWLTPASGTATRTPTATKNPDGAAAADKDSDPHQDEDPDQDTHANEDAFLLAHADEDTHIDGDADRDQYGHTHTDAHWASDDAHEHQDTAPVTHTYWHGDSDGDGHPAGRLPGLSAQLLE